MKIEIEPGNMKNKNLQFKPVLPTLFYVVPLAGILTNKGNGLFLFKSEANHS